MSEPQLVPGALYAVRWAHSQPGTDDVAVACWRSDVNDPDRDEDELPREWWVFLGIEITGKPEEYEALCRLWVTAESLHPGQFDAGVSGFLSEVNRDA